LLADGFNASIGDTFAVNRPFQSLLSAAIGLPLVLSAQELPTPTLLTAVDAQPGDSGQLPLPGEGSSRSASDGSILTRPDARTITLRIPAPRGLITDRDGQPLAQNQVAYQVALQYRQFENVDDAFIIQWGRTRLDALQPLVKNAISKTDEELKDHYTHRRWLPLLVSGQLNEKEARALESKLPSGLMLYPVYRRYYPEGDLAAHLIGYTGSVGKLPTGPINFDEPMWEEAEGRAGFELLFDRQLVGEPGGKRLLFDENGNKLLEEQTKRPRPGGTLVSTLNLKWQKHAESVLKKGCQRGAFVVIDVITGEVLVMASRPSFDLNTFIPGISTEAFEALKSDPTAPLHGRAFMSGYPPASTFKPIVALAALNNGVISEFSTVYSPASMRIGNTQMKNWSSTPEGSINVKRALARSTNTWFYQVGIDVGPSAFLNLSRRLGMGELSGLPLVGEERGLVPSDEYMMKRHKRRILNGDTANMSIGQGDLLATPLQVAQMMAGIANGGALPKLQLIRQIQDTRGRVVQAPLPERRNWLGVDEKAVKIVREGMRDVVTSGGGTGRSAGLSFTTLCGKTGTAQWKPHLRQNLAWFAGFLPYDNPRYAFAVVYEGRPGETVSGGKMAAPMVKSFFEPLKDDIKEIIAPPLRARVVAVDEHGNITEPAPEGEAMPVDPLDGLEPNGDPDGIPAIPVFEDGELSEIEELSPIPPPEMETAPRAVPVHDEEIIDDGDEAP
jgi:penicillin-binding protein 2